MAVKRNTSKKKSGGGGAETPAWEWVVAVAGLLLVCASIGFTIYRAMGDTDSKPDLSVRRKGETTKLRDSYLVEFTVDNSGRQTAAAVTIEGRLARDGETIETSTASLTYTPGNSTRDGGLFFSMDPAGYDLELRALGYEEP